MKFIAYLIYLMVILAGSSCATKPAKKKLELEAYNASKSGRYLISINYYDQLIKYDSLDGSYFYGRAYAYTMLLKKEEAIRDFLKSIHLKYRRGSCYYTLGLLYSYLNDSLAAVYFKMSLDIYPRLEVEVKKEEIQKEYGESLNRSKTKALIVR